MAESARRLTEFNLLPRAPIKTSVGLVRPTCEPLDRESLIGGAGLCHDWLKVNT